MGRKRGMNYPIEPIFCLHIDHKVSQQFPQIFPHRPEAYPPYREQAFDMNFRGRPPDCPRRCSKCQNRRWHHQRKSNNRHGACTFRPEFTGYLPVITTCRHPIAAFLYMVCCHAPRINLICEWLAMHLIAVKCWPGMIMLTRQSIYICLQTKKNKKNRINEKTPPPTQKKRELKKNGTIISTPFEI